MEAYFMGWKGREVRGSRFRSPLGALAGHAFRGQPDFLGQFDLNDTAVVHHQLDHAVAKLFDMLPNKVKPFRFGGWRRGGSVGEGGHGQGNKDRQITFVNLH